MRATRRSPDADDGFTLVELLVVIVVMGIVVSGLTSVIVTTMGVERDQQELQQVIDDGRLSLTRIRQELREARRVLEGSDASTLYFWVDRNQDAIVQPDELVCYAVDPIGGSGRWRIARWTGAEDGCDDVPADAQTLATTLLHDEPFVAYTPAAPDPEEPFVDPTREVRVVLDFEVDNARGPGSVEVSGSIRLRNVP